MKKHCDAVIVFFYNEGLDKVLMLERVKTHYGFDWGFVCGKVEPGENEAQCVHREIKEELGLEGLNLARLKKKRHTEDGETFYHHYYVTILSENTPISYQKEEIKSIRWCPFDDLPKSRAPDDPKEGLKVLKR